MKGAVLRAQKLHNGYFVNRPFIDVLEQCQKGIQYFPVECVWKDKIPAGEYSFFFTTIMLDAVIREKTSATWTPILPGRGLGSRA